MCSLTHSERQTAHTHHLLRICAKYFTLILSNHPHQAGVTQLLPDASCQPSCCLACQRFHYRKPVCVRSQKHLGMRVETKIRYACVCVYILNH